MVETLLRIPPVYPGGDVCKQRGRFGGSSTAFLFINVLFWFCNSAAMMTSVADCSSICLHPSINVCVSVCVCVCVYLQVCELVHFLIENCSDVMGSEVVSLLQSYRQKTSSEHGSGEDPPILKLPTRPFVGTAHITTGLDDNNKQGWRIERQCF